MWSYYVSQGSEKASGEMTFKWRLKEVERETPMESGQRSFQVAGTARAKALEVG